MRKLSGKDEEQKKRCQGVRKEEEERGDDKTDVREEEKSREGFCDKKSKKMANGKRGSHCKECGEETS